MDRRLCQSKLTLQSGNGRREEVFAAFRHHPLNRKVELTGWVAGVGQDDVSVSAVRRRLADDGVKAWAYGGGEAWFRVSRCIEEREGCVVGPIYRDAS